MASNNIKLNTATLIEWNTLLGNPDEIDINKEIHYLFYKNTLDIKEEKRLKKLLKDQKKGLDECKSIIELNTKTNKKISERSECLKYDERLSGLFTIRINEAINEGLINSSEDVDVIYHTLMEEDMDVNRHEELIKEFEIIKSDGNINSIYSPLDPDDAGYVHNPIWSSDEIELAEAKLSEYIDAGLIDSEGSHESNLWFGIMMIRLESIIMEYYGDDGNFLDDGE